MMYIYCGSDISASRKAYGSIKLKYREDGYEIIHTPQGEIGSIIDSLRSSLSLFSSKRVLCFENVLSQKANRSMLADISEYSDTEILIWEEKMTDRDIRRSVKNSKIFTYDVPSNLWKFLDSLYQGNKNNILLVFHQLLDTLDENILLYWLQRRAKELMLAKDNVIYGKSSAPWQTAKLKQQLHKWEYTRLISFYDKLYEVEKNAKTSSSSYSIKENLEILFYYYL